jgi:hypothetical protein
LLPHTRQKTIDELFPGEKCGLAEAIDWSKNGSNQAINSFRSLLFVMWGLSGVALW